MNQLVVLHVELPLHVSVLLLVGLEVLDESLEDLICREYACLLAGLLHVLHAPYQHLPRFQFVYSLANHVVLGEYGHAEYWIVPVLL